MTAMSAAHPDPPVKSFIPSLRFRFRLVHLIYATALLASAFAAIGPWGAVPGILAVCFWTPIFMSARRPRTLLLACIVATVGICPICLCLPAIETAPNAVKRFTCSNNLRVIALALQQYHNVYGEFPPAYIADAQGNPMHSWRVLILPYMGQQALYAQYNFSEPWDGPNNSKLLSAMPSDYACPTQVPTTGARPQCTSYVAVIGEGTLWPGATSRKLGDIKSTTKLGNIPSGPYNTILLLEDSTARIPWTEPRDWTLDEALTELSSTDPKTSGPHISGRHAAHSDASVHFYSAEVSPRTWFELFTIDDRAPPADLADTPRVVRPPTSKVLEFLRPITFLVLLLLPLPWGWLNPTSSGIGKKPSAVGEQMDDSTAEPPA